MTTNDEQRREEFDAICEEREAFEKHHKAIIALHRRLYPFQISLSAEECLQQIEAAERQWRIAKDRIDRLVDEFRMGSRQ